MNKDVPRRVAQSDQASDQQLILSGSSMSPALPAAIVDLGPDAVKAFVEFFTASIENDNTRTAYFRATSLFLTWVLARGLTMPEIEPFHVAAYINGLKKQYSTSSVKQHLAAIRMLGGFLVIRQVLPTNPASAVRGPKQVIRQGKTPVLEDADVRRLFESIQGESPAAIRDRALIAVQLYTFGRVSAILGTDISDYFQQGRAMMLKLHEKGGHEHVMPLNHNAVEYLDAYLARVHATEGPIFRSVDRKRQGYTERRLDRSESWAIWKRRCRQAGLGDRYGNHTPRATGITNYLENGGQLEHAQFMAGHASPRTTKLYDRRTQKVTLDEVERINFA